MWPYHPELLETPVPRYTSYPTAAEFSALDPAPHRDALVALEGPTSLYVHIPFCEKICFYCGCNTGASGRRQRLESYLSALHQEIALVASLIPQGTPIKRISFGGGSPNAIRPDEFLQLLEALYHYFDCSSPELSIELDPRTMSKEWGDAIKVAGISRASLGVQTFAGHCQKVIGRVQDDALIHQTVDWLRNADVTSLNFDLMYGLPQQTRGDLQDSLSRSVEIGADRIALFGYAHVPHIVPRQRAIDPTGMPNQRERFAMAQLGFEYLISRDYAPVGFDHFAKRGSDPLAIAAVQGTLKRNFQGFTDDQAVNLIGLGSSAISSFPQLLAQNEKNSGRYRMLASQDRLTTSHGLARDKDDMLRSRVIERLLCDAEVELPFCLQNEIRPGLVPFIERGLAELNNMTLSITPVGLPYARVIASLCDGYRKQSLRQFSSAI
ncbi:oxygen-independent coproporphyrinogen III oxidase [Altererythrobacter lutimaris]|uniref:Coproporphyrinogen-III oxidase n=1 Tax=Altererythrobacter lutimaris TaxID=2743979 RepID=A0A850H987_9SPHN|nr:oxygen-independent coproporphyrinogen III oxidase [Altererythrobacter lutimaris]NVE93456.1 oxygen-independent coproporphyrinogen III oxidase [Altererythrobacter lutimaris]